MKRSKNKNTKVVRISKKTALELESMRLSMQFRTYNSMLRKIANLEPKKRNSGLVSKGNENISIDLEVLAWVKHDTLRETFDTALRKALGWPLSIGPDK